MLEDVVVLNWYYNNYVLMVEPFSYDEWLVTLNGNDIVEINEKYKGRK